MGKLVRRTVDGDILVAEWSPTDADSMAAAAEALRRGRADGYTAVHWSPDANKPIDELAPDADLIVLTMPMGGG